MWVTSDMVTSWLKTQRRLAGLRMIMVSLWFDLEGSMAADQGALAWWTQESMLLTGIQLYLGTAGVAVPGNPDRCERAFESLEALQRIDSALAVDAWQLWLRDVPLDGDLAGEIRRTLDFLTVRLAVPSGASRNAALEAWAWTVRDLRLVGTGFGIAKSDSWYLSADASVVERKEWYDEIMDLISSELNAK